MENLLDYGPEALLELHAQEKQLTERMQKELQKLQQEVTQMERERERNEEGELNEINKRLVKLKCDTQVLKTKERHELRTVNMILSSNLETISKEKEKLKKVQEHIVENEKRQQENELHQLQELLANCQEKMSSGSLDDESIDKTLATLLQTLKTFDNNLTEEGTSIEQKTNLLRQQNAELQRSIDEATAGISYVRRRTCIGTEIQREIMNPMGARRHSEVSPFSLRGKKQQNEEKKQTNP